VYYVDQKKKHGAKKLHEEYKSSWLSLFSVYEQAGVDFLAISTGEVNEEQALYWLPLPDNNEHQKALAT
jgi:hypothetical protein